MAVSRQCSFVWLRSTIWWRLSSLALTVGFAVAFSEHFLLAQESGEFFEEERFADLHVAVPGEECDVCAPEAAHFDQWEDLVDGDSTMHWDQAEIQPFDWVRSFGFRHSSTHGPHIGKGIPLEGTSWLNRPYHVDWFIGPLLGDQLIENRVSQENVLIGGFRIGWDFDYYWGLEWRYGRGDPNVQYAEPQTVPNEESYSVFDIDLIYYPWGDSKVRPYCLLGVGAAQIDFIDDVGTHYDATLATMPFGGGIRFQQWPWLLWRIEVLDNLSFGDDGLATMHNVSITAGMEFRFGARPASYWPWRTSRKIW